jgi:rubrerythrin
MAAPAMEGGLTTEEYLQLYQPDLERPAEVISLAMAIEAQALDLYQRAAERAETDAARSALMQIANEERSHLEQLGKLFETL